MTPGTSLDRRGEPRLPVSVDVQLCFDDSAVSLSARLMDSSCCGFHVRHGGPLPTPGKIVGLHYGQQTLATRVMWSVKSGSRTDTGLLREEVYLIRCLLAGDGESLMQLVAPYLRCMRATVRCILPNHADGEEVLQESLLKVLAHIDQFHPGQSFKAWLLQIATNEALKYVRRNRKQVAPPWDRRSSGETAAPYFEQFADPHGSPADVLERKEFRDALAVALGSLGEMYRQVFVLRDLQHMRMAEIAARLGIKIDTANTRLHRARLLLRKELTDSPVTRARGRARSN